MIAPRRHDLVWLDPAAFGGGVATRAAVDWAAARLPFVQRTSAPGTGTALGWCRPVAAPPPRRMPVLAPPGAVVARARPPRLADALESAPRGWRPLLRDLSVEASRAGLCLRVYGSLGWEWVTGLRYLWPGSDLDVLIEGAEHVPMQRLAAILRVLSAGSRPRIDGELVFSSGDAVAWREFQQSRCEALLVRGLEGAHLVRRAALRPLAPYA